MLLRAEHDREVLLQAGALAAQSLPAVLTERLSEYWREPDWLRHRRLAARFAYEQLPLPRWQRGIRGWWTTDISALRLERIAPYTLGPSPVLPAKDADRRHHAGLIVQRDSVATSQYLDPGLAAQGVVFTPLSHAVLDYPDLVREHLGALVPEDGDKFVSLHNALWSGGVFIYVPAGVEVTLPLHARFHMSAPESAMFCHTLLIAERGSKVSYVEEYSSADFDRQGLHSGIVEVYAKEGAEVQFVTVHNWGETVFDFAQKRASVLRDARVQWVTGFLGGALTRASISTNLREQGAALEMAGVFFASGRQHLDLTSRTFHEARHTRGDVLFKGVVKDAARSSFEGLIRVEKNAQETASYLSDHTLQLSPEAKSDSIPSLEIEANDVRVSHGATIGKLDEEQVFYLMSRGLPRRLAERSIIGGFFAPALRRVPLAKTRQDLLEAIERKMGD